MIHSPRRSVTRFFIPLLDVMVLLFSMFMLMPIVQKAAEATEDQPAPRTAEQERDAKALQKQVDRLTKEVSELQARKLPREDVRKAMEELERLRKEKIKTLQERLAIRVLEFDPKNGDLLYYEPGLPHKRRVIESKEAAAALIRKHRLEVAQPQSGPTRELYYLFLLPRGASALEEGQLEEYNRWFQDVPHGIDTGGVGAK